MTYFFKGYCWWASESFCESPTLPSTGMVCHRAGKFSDSTEHFRAISFYSNVFLISITCNYFPTTLLNGIMNTHIKMCSSVLISRDGRQLKTHWDTTKKRLQLKQWIVQSVDREGEQDSYACTTLQTDLSRKIWTWSPTICMTHISASHWCSARMCEHVH